MSPRTEQTVAVLGMTLLGVLFVVQPGAAILLIGGAIGLLGVVGWVAGKLGI